MDEKARKFVEALSAYTNDLQNGFGWQAWATLGTEGSATVNVSMNRFGKLVVAAVETHEGEVTALEEELKEAKKTIKAQGKENESLTDQINNLTSDEDTQSPETVVPEETKEVTEEPTRTRRKRKT